VSLRQAKRLREEGMLRCLGQDHPTGSRGSRSRYLASEVDQLALVMRVGAAERRFDERRVLVAWHGGWVEPDALRRSLVALFDAVSASVRDAIRDSEDPGHAAELLVGGARKERSSATTRLMRERLQGDSRALQRVMYAFALMAAGGDVAWYEHDPSSSEASLASLVERATAVDRARNDPVFRGKRLAASAPPAQETLEELRAAGLFAIEDLAGCLRGASESTIRQAFIDAHAMAGMALPAEAIEASSEPDIGGLASLRAIDPGQGDALAVALLVRNTLLMRPIVPPAAFDDLAAAVSGARGPLTAFKEIRRAFPEHAEVLTLDLEQRLAELPDHEASQIRRRVLELLDSRPDLRALLEGDR
jgi:hypothetical protein